MAMSIDGILCVLVSFVTNLFHTVFKFFRFDTFIWLGTTKICTIIYMFKFLWSIVTLGLPVSLYPISMCRLWLFLCLSALWGYIVYIVFIVYSRTPLAILPDMSGYMDSYVWAYIALSVLLHSQSVMAIYLFSKS